MISAKWLVEYCIGQIGRGYWYGTFGQVASQALLNNKRNQYPSYYDQSKYSVQFTSQFGQKVHDCAGLIKGALWCNSVDGTPAYNASQDVGANTLINSCCTVTGSIGSLPEIAGLLLWKDGHIGVYIGNGYAVEAKGHDYGVQKTKVAGRGWTKWGKCKWVDYSDAPTPTPTGNTYTVRTNSGDALRLRAEPNTSSAQIGYYDNGSDIEAVKVVEGESIGGVTAWVYDGRGYASGKYLVPTPVVPSPTPTPPTPTPTPSYSAEDAMKDITAIVDKYNKQ